MWAYFKLLQGALALDQGFFWPSGKKNPCVKYEFIFHNMYGWTWTQKDPNILIQNPLISQCPNPQISQSPTSPILKIDDSKCPNSPIPKYYHMSKQLIINQGNRKIGQLWFFIPQSHIPKSSNPYITKSPNPLIPQSTNQAIMSITISSILQSPYPQIPLSPNPLISQ